MDRLQAVRHLARTLDSTQIEALAVLLADTDWTSEVRTHLYDALMGAGRRIDADAISETAGDAL